MWNDWGPPCSLLVSTHLWHFEEGPSLLWLEFAWRWLRFPDDWPRIRVVVLMELRIHTCLGSISTSTFSDFWRFALSLQLVCLGSLFLLLRHPYMLLCFHQSDYQGTFGYLFGMWHQHSWVQTIWSCSSRHRTEWWKMSCSGLILLMRSSDILNSNQGRIIGQIQLLNQLFDRCMVARTDLSGSACWDLCSRHTCAIHLCFFLY